MPQFRKSVLLSFVLALSIRDARGIVPTTATQALLDARPGSVVMLHGDRARAVYGVTLASDSDPVTTTDDFVSAFLAERADAFGVTGVQLALREKMNIRNDKFTVYTYTQRIEGLPVHNTLVRVPVLRGATERIGYVGMRLVPLPAAALPADVIDGAQGVAVVSQSATYGHLTTFGAPEKVIYEDTNRTVHRVWRFFGYDDDEAYHFFVDTNTSQIVGTQDARLEGQISGNVTGFGTPCRPPGDPLHADCCPIDFPECSNCCPADNPATAESCPQSFPMQGAQVSIVGGAQQFADANGGYLFTGLTDGQPVTIESRLIGEWVTVENEVYSGTNLQVSQVGVLPGSVVNLTFNSTNPQTCATSPSARPSEFNTSQVNAFLAVQKTHDWFDALQSDPTPIDRNLLVQVNTCGDFNGEICQAGYLNQGTPYLFLANRAESW